MSRTPLSERKLPNYTRKEELANMWTHIAGAVIGIAVLVLVIFISLEHSNIWGLVSGSIYAFFMICLFCISSIYHGLRPSRGKKVMQVLDHCAIYFLIAGTYTPILLSAMRPVHPGWAWTIFGAQWALTAFATVFTAIDHNKYMKLSMACYIAMGWFIIIALKPTIEVLGTKGFMWLLAGGLSYTLGAVLYGVGKKKPVVHTIFHVFVDIGAVLQAVCILKYVI
ncbi:MAG: PAQR family membrane homeostasis protein TrhA [Candidatus Limivicinus sp.]|jgi:hemolysin III